MAQDDDVLMVVEVSAPRRFFGLACLWSLAGLLGWVAFSGTPTVAGTAFLLCCAGGAGFLAVRLTQATSGQLELTRTELRDTGGGVVAQVDQIARLDRSMFAFKPSSGFLLVLTQKQPRVWRPGLWWRTGRRVGVGGMVNAPQAKAMAEVISAMLVERNLDAP